MTAIRLSSIAAMAQNRIIGKNNALIWHIPEDLKHFKRTTLGKPIVMGRKSYDALGKPLPGRANIVISRSHKSIPNNQPTPTHAKMEGEGMPVPEQDDDGPFLVSTIEEGIALGKKIAQDNGKDEIFIGGGGEIYKQTLETVDRIYLSLIHRDYEGDTWFPEFDWDDWTITDEKKIEGDPDFTIYTLDKK